MTNHLEPLGEPANETLVTNKCWACKGSGKDIFAQLCKVCYGVGEFYQQTLYRYYDCLGPGNSVELKLERWLTIKTTAQGYWIKYPNNKGKKFILSAKKQWAYLTMDAALASYYSRKQMQVKILKNQLNRARIARNLTPNRPHSSLPPE